MHNRQLVTLYALFAIVGPQVALADSICIEKTTELTAKASEIVTRLQQAPSAEMFDPALPFTLLWSQKSCIVGDSTTLDLKDIALSDRPQDGDVQTIQQQQADYLHSWPQTFRNGAWLSTVHSSNYNPTKT